MTSIIKLHAISGSMDESPPCYILQVDDFRFLLDCGWDENFNMDIIKELKRYINNIDAVLLSHPDPLHLGALPYTVGRLGLNCPIYATLPVYKMGQMFMYDLYQSRHNMENFDLFTLDDVDAAFDKIVQLKYHQSVPLKGKGAGLTITPLPAGHMIGGTIWKILKEGEEDIVYATDFSHKKERHLNGCDLEKLQRPCVLLMDVLNANYQQARRRVRDEKLMTTILSTLRNGGSVLVAVDTAGRVLELAHMLDQLWRNKESGLIAYSLVLLSNVSYNVVEFAKSQIEWMSDKLMKSFEGHRSNPFQLRHLQLCYSANEVLRIPGSKVVLASSPDLESGFSRDLFVSWAGQAENSIILTTRTSPGTLARDLIDNGGDRNIDLVIKKRLKLEGVELEEYMRTVKVKEAIKKEDEMSLSSDSDSDDDIEMSVITGKHDIIVKSGMHKHSGFFKSNKKQHAMFPFFEEKTKFDEYGEIIKLEDYRLAEVMEVETEVEKPAPVPVKKDEDIKEIIEIPTKCTEMKKQIAVKATIQYIDFEGKCDGQSLMVILKQLKARNVICLRGDENAASTIKSYCLDQGCNKVFTPRCGETVDATTESHIYQVRLTDALVSGLHWQKGGDGADIAWVNGIIALRESEPSTQQNDVEEEQIYTLEPMPLNEAPSHQAIFINELQLANLRQALSRSNISSEFSGGILWCCNGTLAIRLCENGTISMDGCLTEEFYKVRDILYDQYAIV